MPPPASQSEKPNGLWSRPSVPWANGVRPNSPAQTTSVSSSRPRCFRSFEQPGDRLIDRPGVVVVAVLQACRAGPSGRAPHAGAGQLDEPHAALDEPPGEQALPAEHLRRLRLRIEAVQLAASPRVSSLDVHQLRHGGLHAEGQLVVGDRRFERVDVADAVEHAADRACRSRASLFRCSSSLRFRRR